MEGGFPSLYVSPVGTISAFLTSDVVVEISVDRAIRIRCMGKFAASMSPDNKSAALSHELASVYQEDSSTFAVFRAGNVEKQLVVGNSGIVFSMDSLNESFLVSSTLDFNGSNSGIVPIQRRLFPSMKRDFTLRQFYGCAEYGKRYTDMCHELVGRAHFSNNNGELLVVVNGVYIRLDQGGNVEISSRPRSIRFTPLTGAIQMRSASIDLAVDCEGRGYVSQGSKRVHASCSGLVVADDLHVTSMDHFGRLINSV